MITPRHVQNIKEQQPENEFPQSTPGYFEHLEPIDNAVKSFLTLAECMDAHILSAPSVFNPLCYIVSPEKHPNKLIILNKNK